MKHKLKHFMLYGNRRYRTKTNILYVMRNNVIEGNVVTDITYSIYVMFVTGTLLYKKFIVFAKECFKK